MFDLFDSNGGGTIDADELDATLRSVDICLKADEIEEVLTVIDKDGKSMTITHILNSITLPSLSSLMTLLSQTQFQTGLQHPFVKRLFSTFIFRSS